MISTFQLIQVSARQGPLYRDAFGSSHPSFLVKKTGIDPSGFCKTVPCLPLYSLGDGHSLRNNGGLYIVLLHWNCTPKFCSRFDASVHINNGFLLVHTYPTFIYQLKIAPV